MKYAITCTLAALLMLACIRIVSLEDTIRYQEVQIDQLQDTVIDLEEGR